MPPYVYAPYSQGKHGLACDGVAMAPVAQEIGTPVAEGPDPFADPVTRRAIIAAREARSPRSPSRARSASGT